jgi:hypothetical protein
MNKKVIVGILIIIASILMGVGVFTNSIFKIKEGEKSYNAGFNKIEICRDDECKTISKKTHGDYLLGEGSFLLGLILVLWGLVLGGVFVAKIGGGKFLRTLRKGFSNLSLIFLFYFNIFIILPLVGVSRNSAYFMGDAIRSKEDVPLGYGFYCIVTGLIIIFILSLINTDSEPDISSPPIQPPHQPPPLHQPPHQPPPPLHQTPHQAPPPLQPPPPVN